VTLEPADEDTDTTTLIEVCCNVLESLLVATPTDAVDDVTAGGRLSFSQ